PQVAERRVARTKVVDRDPDPQAFELAEAANRLLGLMGHHTFGDLQYQQLGWQPAVLERKADRGHQARVSQLDARQVDRDDKRRPDAAGVYMAIAAERSMAVAVGSAGELRAIPTVAPMRTGRSLSSKGRFSAARARVAMLTAWSSSTSSSSNANSSPPNRAAVSPGRTASPSLGPTCPVRMSPSTCPRESLTVSKSSRS